MLLYLWGIGDNFPNNNIYIVFFFINFPDMYDTVDTTWVVNNFKKNMYFKVRTPVFTELLGYNE